MLESFNGLPLHPLVVHLAVVAAPVAALLALVWAARPRGRALGAVTAGVSLLAFLAVMVARSTGEAMLPSLGYSEQDPGPVAEHAQYANVLAVAAGLLALAAGLAWWRFARRGRERGAVAVVLRIVLVAAALATLAAAVLAGHAGALLVWGQQSP